MFQHKSFVKDMGPPLSGMGFSVLVLNAPCAVTASSQPLCLRQYTGECRVQFTICISIFNLIKKSLS